MATYTSNYQLHQWVPEDDFLRTDFNTDFQKIDAALARKAEKSTVTSLQTQVAGKADASTVPRVAAGTYTGNGTTKSISLGFQPRAVIIPIEGYTVAILLTGQTCAAGSITSSGFTATRDPSYSRVANTNGQTYAYLAIK